MFVPQRTHEMKILTILILVCLACVTVTSSAQVPTPAAQVPTQADPLPVGGCCKPQPEILLPMPSKKRVQHISESALKRRQEQLKRDTDKLHRLTTELKQHVDKSDDYVLSVDVIKKLAAIEKLSKSMQRDMRY